MTMALAGRQTLSEFNPKMTCDSRATSTSATTSGIQMDSDPRSSYKSAIQIAVEQGMH